MHGGAGRLTDQIYMIEEIDNRRDMHDGPGIHHLYIHRTRMTDNDGRCDMTDSTVRPYRPGHAQIHVLKARKMVHFHQLICQARGVTSYDCRWFIKMN